jgi:hypothetical protein
VCYLTTSFVTRNYNSVLCYYLLCYKKVRLLHKVCTIKVVTQMHQLQMIKITQFPVRMKQLSLQIHTPRHSSFWIFVITLCPLKSNTHTYNSRIAVPAKLACSEWGPTTEKLLTRIIFSGCSLSGFLCDKVKVHSDISEEHTTYHHF